MVFGIVTLQIAASDAGTPAQDLVVEWSRDGVSWSAATYNAGTGYYEASLDTAGEPEDSQVTLRARATDNAGQATEATPVTVTVNNDNDAPEAAFTYNCNSNVCDFDASSSRDPDGATASYAWAFGDGSWRRQTVRHTFTTAGTYS
jgi:PKD repeat protein